MLSVDERFIKRTFELAANSAGKTSPNPLVGAVLVKKNKIIAEGFHKKAGLPHAEIVALNNAGDKAKGAVLYVNLEPCFHWGKTPPCVDKIIRAGIGKVVISTLDPNPLVGGKSIKKLRSAGIEVKTGILKREALRLNEMFFKYIRAKTPFVVLKWAQSIDGRINYRKNTRGVITSYKARLKAKKLRSVCDAVLVGINTILVDNPFLDSALKGKEMAKIVLDPKLKVSPSANIFKKGKVFIVCRNGVRKKKKLPGNSRILFCPFSEYGGFDLNKLLVILGLEGIVSLFVEGGGKTIGYFLRSKLADKVCVFLSAKIVGKNGTSSVDIDLSSLGGVCLSDARYEHLGGDLFIEAYINRKKRLY